MINNLSDYVIVIMSIPNPCQVKKQSPFQIIGKMLVVGCFLVAAYYGYNAHKETAATPAEGQNATLDSRSESVTGPPSLKETAEKKKTESLAPPSAKKPSDNNCTQTDRSLAGMPENS